MKIHAVRFVLLFAVAFLTFTEWVHRSAFALSRMHRQGLAVRRRKLSSLQIL